MRVCLVPLKYGKSWISFLAEPVVNMAVIPTIGDSDFPVSSLPKVDWTNSDKTSNKRTDHRQVQENDIPEQIEH